MGSWVQNLESVLPLDFVLPLLAAILAGGVIGWERERRDKPAGLRTHMLVSLGAAVFMLATAEYSHVAAGDDAASGIRADPLRALAGVIGGVGFLGAGAIIQSRGSVWGITTAASIWVSAAAGTCCGLGLYRLAIVSSLLAVGVLWGLRPLEHAIQHPQKSRVILPQSGAQERQTDADSESS